MGWIVAVVEDRFRLTRGSMKIFVKTAESGRLRALGFCLECGTRINSRPPNGEPGAIFLRVGAIRQRAELRPRAHLWARSAQTWINDLKDLPRIEKQP